MRIPEVAAPKEFFAHKARLSFQEKQATVPTPISEAQKFVKRESNEKT